MPTPSLTLPYLVASQVQKEVTHNDALNDLDALVQLSVISRTTNTPPPSPALGDAYIVGSAPTGAWNGAANSIAFWNNGWRLKVPKTGWLAWSKAEDKLVRFTGSTWTPYADSGSALSNNLRLTLTSGTPVTTADVTGAGTLYLTAYKGNAIALYVGGQWVVRQTDEITLSLAGLASGKPYDVFCYDNGGTPALESLAWTNTTTRATALTRQNGLWVKAGDATRRYVGSFYTTGTGITEDSQANRYVWNYDNRVQKILLRTESAASWAYTTNVLRPANNNSANVVNFIIGVSEDLVDAECRAAWSNTTVGAEIQINMGLDSTTGPSATYRGLGTTLLANYKHYAITKYSGTPSAGKHSLSWLEASVAMGTTTWYADGTFGATCGLLGRIFV